MATVGPLAKKIVFSDIKRILFLDGVFKKVVKLGAGDGSKEIQVALLWEEVEPILENIDDLDQLKLMVTEPES